MVLEKKCKQRWRAQLFFFPRLNNGYADMENGQIIFWFHCHLGLKKGVAVLLKPFRMHVKAQKPRPRRWFFAWTESSIVIVVFIIRLKCLFEITLCNQFGAIQ